MGEIGLDSGGEIGLGSGGRDGACQECGRGGWTWVGEMRLDRGGECDQVGQGRVRWHWKGVGGMGCGQVGEIGLDSGG